MLDYSFFNTLLAKDVLVKSDPIISALGWTRMIDEGITIDQPRRRRHSKYLVNVSSTSCFQNEMNELLEQGKVNPDISNFRMTCGRYSITYFTEYVRKDEMRTGRSSFKCEKPYRVELDLLNFALWVSGPNELNELAKVMPEINFLITNTNYCDELFDIAKELISVPIWLTMNVIELWQSKSVRAVFLQKDSIYEYERVHLPQRGDYYTTIDQVEQLKNVKAEMRKNKADYDHRRYEKQKADGTLYRLTPEGREKNKARCKAYRERKKQERLGTDNAK